MRERPCLQVSPRWENAQMRPTRVQWEIGSDKNNNKKCRNKPKKDLMNDGLFPLFFLLRRGKGLEGTALSFFCFRYLVDPASSDMLVSKIKPCTCQYKLLYGETANGSLNQL